MASAMVLVSVIGMLGAASAQAGSYSQPRWWAKYKALSQRTEPLSLTSPLSVGANVDASNEDGPQSETSIAINPY